MVENEEGEYITVPKDFVVSTVGAGRGSWQKSIDCLAYGTPMCPDGNKIIPKCGLCPLAKGDHTIFNTENKSEGLTYNEDGSSLPNLPIKSVSSHKLFSWGYSEGGIGNDKGFVYRGLRHYMGKVLFDRQKIK